MRVDGSQGRYPSVVRAREDERRSLVRQKRVVLAPVAGVESAEFLVSPSGRAQNMFAGDGGKTNSSP